MTRYFKIPTSKVLLVTIYFHALWLLGIMAVLILSTLILGISVDIRILIVAFLILCIVLPGALAWIYFYHALKPLCVFNILPHSLSLGSQDVRVSICKTKFTDEDEDFDSEEELTGIESEKIVDKEEPEIIIREIPYRVISKFYIYGNMLIYPIGEKGKDGMLIISDDAFSSATEMNEFVEKLNRKIKSPSTKKC